MSLESRIKKNLAVYLPALQTWALSGFSQGEIETIAGHVAKRAGRNPSQPLIVFARALVENATAVPNRFTENGEQALLDRLAPLPVRMLFDVGANVGTWSAHALKVFPRPISTPSRSCRAPSRCFAAACRRPRGFSSTRSG